MTDLRPAKSIQMQMDKEEENIYLVDGNSLCYRAYYAIPNLSTSKGMPTNAVYGVVGILKKLIKVYSPDRMVFVFDLKGPTVRHEKFADYKINRKPMPDDLIEQIPRIKDVIRAYNIPMCELQGYEADDIIATLAERAKKKGMEVIIVTSDKDALQLVDDKVKVLTLRTDEDKIYDASEVMKKFGVEPDGMIELMALTGDPSDNIPGVKGIGDVTAAKLISEFGTVDNIYKNIDKVSSDSLKKKLVESKEIAELSRELVILDRDVPVELDPEDSTIKEPDIAKLAELYREFEFGKLLQEVAPKAEQSGSYSKAESEKDVNKLVEAVLKSKKAAIRPAIDPVTEKVVGIAVSAGKNGAVFVPMAGKACTAALKAILEDEKILKIGHDLKNDILALARAGMEMKGAAFDVMIADYLTDPSLPKHDLAGMAMRVISYNLPGDAGSSKWDDKGQATMDLQGASSVDHMLESARADVIFRLYDKLEAEMKEKHLTKLFKDVEMPLVAVLAAMEAEGVGLDVKYLKKLSVEMGRELDEVTDKIYSLAGETFNINSPKQLQVILFDKLKLAAGKKTKTGVSTDESVLSRLARDHELPRLLLEYREMNKLKTGYYDSLAELADKKTGRLHTHFNQAVTATGRLSSSEPNLQNIPIKTERGREIRRAFIPSGKGRMLIAADYSQIELRILAHLSGDGNLIGAFKNNEDVHRYTASLVYGVPIKDVSDKMRAAAKTINFGIIYGMGPFSLAKDLEISVEQAQSFINEYFKRYGGIKDLIDKTIATARVNGYVTTILNRRRYVPEINSRNDRLRSFAERVAVNTPVQGSAADLIKLAMIACHKEFFESDVKMTIQVHDELVFDVPEAKMKSVAAKVRKIMEGVMDLDVPLKVDIEAGENWYDMGEIK